MAAAWFGIAITLEFEERWYEAIHYVKRALELNSENGEYWFLLGDCEREMNNLEEAEECYRKAIEYNPDNIDIWFEFADFLYQNNRLFEAIEITASGIKFHVDSIELQIRLVMYLYVDGQLKEAYNHFEDVLDKENSNFETAEKEIKDKLLALDKQIQDIKSDPNKTSQEKNSEIANLNTSLKAEQQKITDLKAEKEALTSGEKYTPEFNRSAQQAQAYVPPQPGSAEYNKLQNVMNQNGLQGSPDFYDGKFVCDTSGTGLFATNEKPRNQGGKVANELYYAIANAAKVSGVNVVSVGCYNFRTIAGSNNLSKHANGDACDVLPKGEDAKKTAFLVLFLANTGNFNTVGSYADRKFDHSHLGADCGGTWCPYQKGSGLEPWKELAFRTVFQVCGQQFNPSNRPSKSFVQNCAKKAAETFCKKQAGV
jgi:tetratricopeptide (TPR) repeat protein